MIILNWEFLFDIHLKFRIWESRNVTINVTSGEIDGDVQQWMLYVVGQIGMVYECIDGGLYSDGGINFNVITSVRKWRCHYIFVSIRDISKCKHRNKIKIFLAGLENSKQWLCFWEKCYLHISVYTALTRWECTYSKTHFFNPNHRYLTNIAM